ncbi:unnamed protein product [Durusdinium trenchii]|uniref:Uncharacterized protein n=1 Tax=Durusdinium trenchii TaxID=1381693 RepID=A0ABP0RNY9_9DINO
MAKTEEEELQAQVRSLEQRELAQMRQGAILQCKLEEAELKHKDLAAEVEDRRARVREEQQEQRMRRQQEALARVEKDLQRRLEELRTRELEFEKSLKQEQSKKDSLEDEVQYWRSCGQALLRRAGTLKESVSQHQESRHTDLQVEMKAMDAQAVELRSRVKEVEMMTKTQGLLHSLSQAEQSLAASQAKAEARKPRASLEDVEKGFGEEEIEYWRRKMQEKTAEVDRLGHEQKRLKALLLRSGSTDVAEYLSTRHCHSLSLNCLMVFINYRLLKPWHPTDSLPLFGKPLPMT